MLPSRLPVYTGDRRDFPNGKRTPLALRPAVSLGAVPVIALGGRLEAEKVVGRYVEREREAHAPPRRKSEQKRYSRQMVIPVRRSQSPLEAAPGNR